jgi:hypothetical protein
VTHGHPWTPRPPISPSPAQLPEPPQPPPTCASIARAEHPQWDTTGHYGTLRDTTGQQSTMSPLHRRKRQRVSRYIHRPREWPSCRPWSRWYPSSPARTRPPLTASGPIGSLMWMGKVTEEEAGAKRADHHEDRDFEEPLTQRVEAVRRRGHVSVLGRRPSAKRSGQLFPKCLHCSLRRVSRVAR